ncbi:hypothetical protein RTBOTA2_000168 [Rhodotorula toruloides]|uniref:Uncharacterized protein n=1 Tax=Rhodotorula toruloides TaxID=5286 RepID=A0A2T0AGJ6_RHOTO|nr:hypothetical protein RTBOTA2_000168 [Rhodotorula toruloides]PRQ77110.1 hypothetical protein AAT19DRAFT_12528 [Rhodotorula toruloides]
MHSTSTPSTSRRTPLAPLPVDRYHPAPSPSPKKPRLVPLSHRDMSLLPSPFLPSTTPRSTSGPLTTLYERSPLSFSPSRTRPQDGDATTPLEASPRGMMAAEDAQRRADDEMPASSPRRLIDAFVQASRTGQSPSTRRKGSLPPPSPRRSAQDIEKDEPEDRAWDFYEDDVDEATSVTLPAASVEDSETEATPVDKENTRPSPPARRRSTSLLSQASSATLAASTTLSAPTPTAAPRTPPRAPQTPPPPSPSIPAFSPDLSASYTLSHPPVSAAISSAGLHFADSSATSFAAIAVSAAAHSPSFGAEAGLTGFAPLFNERMRGAKRESLDGGEEEHKRKRRKSDEAE